MMNPIIFNNNKNNWGYYIDIETQTILNENSILFLDTIIKTNENIPSFKTQLKQLQELQQQELELEEQEQLEEQTCKSDKQYIISYIGITFIICMLTSF